MGRASQFGFGQYKGLKIVEQIEVNLFMIDYQFVSQKLRIKPF
jgi:hypothetical protein